MPYGVAPQESVHLKLYPVPHFFPRNGKLLSYSSAPRSMAKRQLDLELVLYPLRFQAEPCWNHCARDRTAATGWRKTNCPTEIPWLLLSPKHSSRPSWVSEGRPLVSRIVWESHLWRCSATEATGGSGRWEESGFWLTFPTPLCYQRRRIARTSCASHNETSFAILALARL